jgi:hypothetical protein
MDIEATHLERVFDLYAQGLCLQAYRYTEQLGPLHEWSGTEARIMGGRLAGNLGRDAPGLLAASSGVALRP